MKKLLLLAMLTIFMFFYSLSDINAEKMTLIDANKIIDDLKAEIKQKPNDIGARIELGGTYFYLQEYELAKKYPRTQSSIAGSSIYSRKKWGRFYFSSAIF